MNIFELHKRMTYHLFPTYSSRDERFLTLALCGEVAELGELVLKLSVKSGLIANLIKKRWRDGTQHVEEIRDELADIRVYLELLAKCFGIEGKKLDQRVVTKLRRVVEKYKERLGNQHILAKIEEGLNARSSLHLRKKSSRRRAPHRSTVRIRRTRSKQRLSAKR